MATNNKTLDFIVNSYFAILHCLSCGFGISLILHFSGINEIYYAIFSVLPFFLGMSQIYNQKILFLIGGICSLFWPSIILVLLFTGQDHINELFKPILLGQPKTFLLLVFASWLFFSIFFWLNFQNNSKCGVD